MSSTNSKQKFLYSNKNVIYCFGSIEACLSELKSGACSTTLSKLFAKWLVLNALLLEFLKALIETLYNATESFHP